MRGRDRERRHGREAARERAPHGRRRRERRPHPAAAHHRGRAYRGGRRHSRQDGPRRGPGAVMSAAPAFGGTGPRAVAGSNKPRHFLDLDRFDKATLRRILEMGKSFKRGEGLERQPLKGKTLAMLFEKPSTRTRVSFEVGMRRLGGEVVVLERDGMQLGRGETVADTARVLSRYVDAIMLRTTKEEKLLELAEHATVPVINGLTDRTHPCQLMADVMTFEEHRGPIAGKVVAWAGDGNNMATSWIHAALRFGFTLRLACPKELGPPQQIVAWARKEGANVLVTDKIEEAMAGADCVVTDTWVSMGEKEVDTC